MLPNTIVVPLDGSSFAERALPIAKVLARRFSAGLVLMTTRSGEWDVDGKAYLEALANQERDLMTEVASVDIHPAARAIAEVSAETGRLVCMTSHGRGGLRWAALGSVAEEVIRERTEPTVLVGRHCDPEWGADLAELIVCVDASRDDDTVVQVAAEWAKALSMRARVTHVIHPLDVEGATRRDVTLTAIAERLRGEGVDAHEVLLRSSYTAGAISDYARDLPGSMLAMNTHGRTGVKRIALGSVALATVGLATCPVLVAPVT